LPLRLKLSHSSSSTTVDENQVSGQARPTDVRFIPPSLGLSSYVLTRYMVKS
jgi:hypothetical protein